MCRHLLLFMLALLLIGSTPNISYTACNNVGAVDLHQRQAAFKSLVNGVSQPTFSDADIAGELRAVLEIKADHVGKVVKEASSIGVKIEVVYHNLVQVRTEPYILDRLSKNHSILCVRPPLTPILNEFTSEGVAAIKADMVHARGFLGENIKVAVIDIGFDPFNQEIMSSVKESKSFRADGDIGGGDDEAKVHGTACAEIVVDVAPKAQLYLMNFETDLEYLNAVDYAISIGMDVITTSVGFVNAGPYDGTNYIAKAADDAAQSGILFVTSVGNAALSHWRGVFTDDDEDGFHNFVSNDETNDILLESGKPVKIFLSWDDWPTSPQDYDLYLYDAALNLVAASTNPQTGVQPPTESIFYSPSITDIYRIVIVRSNASESRMFRLFCFLAELEHYEEEGSITSPADADGALAVGAVSLDDSLVQPFSSRGPTDDGRIKPDLMAHDGVSTSSYGPLAFYGTSAAAPHVAGVAAILLSSNRSLTLDELRLTLESSATDKGAPGRDTIYGMGVIDAHKAFQRIHGELQKSTISVHAYPDEYQYPEELSQELSARILISYVYDGIASSMNALTPIQIQADIGSNATFTVESIPQSYAWNEWDNYGYGRTSSETLKITLNEDHAVIAYFTKINVTNNTVLEVHAHSIDFQYPDEPTEELPLTLKVTYIYNRTIHDAESIKIGPTPKRLTVDPNSTAIMTVVTTPSGFNWNRWQRVDGESTSNQTIHISVEGNTTSVVVAYFEPSTVEVGFTVTSEPEFIIYIPGQTVDFNIHVAPINEFDGEVILKVEAPPEVEVKLTPERLHPPGSAKLTVTINEETRDRMEITVKAIFGNTTTLTKVTLQAWAIPGFSASTIPVGSIIALTILYFERKRSKCLSGQRNMRVSF